MDLDRVVTLLRAVSEQTKKSKLHWSERAPNSFTVSIAKISISITEHFDEGTNPEYADPDYYLGIENVWGEQVDSFSDSELKDIMPDSYKTMRALYKGAKRSAKGVAKLIDDMLLELDSDIPF